MMILVKTQEILGETRDKHLDRKVSNSKKIILSDNEFGKY